MKKTIILIIFLLASVAIAFGLYFIFFKTPKISPTPTPITNEPSGRLPVTKDQWERMTIDERAQANLPLYQWSSQPEIPITPEQPVSGPEISDVALGGRTWMLPVATDIVARNISVAADGQNALFYNSKDSHFYQIDSSGNKVLLSEQPFYNVENVNWSPRKDRAIIEYPDGFKVMYDFKNQKQYTLPNNWQDFSWDSQGEQIAFKATSQYPENNWLAVAQADGTEAKPIEHMGENGDKVTVSWSPNRQIVAFSATGQPRGTWQQEMLLIGQNGENFKSLIIDGRGFEPQWNPQGDSIAYSVYNSGNGYRPTLYLVKAEGDNIGADKINTGLNTWSHKCSYNTSGSSLYCAVPRELPDGAGMLPELAADSRDDFYKIDTATGEVSFLAEGAMGGYNVSQIFISRDESILYFVDQQTGRLRSVRLK